MINTKESKLIPLVHKARELDQPRTQVKYSIPINIRIHFRISCEYSILVPLTVDLNRSKLQILIFNINYVKNHSEFRLTGTILSPRSNKN